MTSTLVRSPMTAEDFLATGDSDGFELVHGVPEELCMGGESSWLGGEVYGQIRNVCVETNVGVVFPQEAPLAIWPADPSHFRKPDVMFFKRGSLPAGPLPKSLVHFVPDLIVEVVSPNDEAARLEKKLEDYRLAGIRLIWVIYPETENAHVHRRSQLVEVVPRGGTLDGEDILPGFSLDLAALFAAAANAIPQ